MENLKFLIEKVEKQNNNSMNKMITPYCNVEKNEIALQLVDLSIQAFYIGIKALNGCRHIGMINPSKFEEKFKKISDQINYHLLPFIDPMKAMQIDSSMMNQSPMMIPDPMMIQCPTMPQSMNSSKEFLQFKFNHSDKYVYYIQIEKGKKVQELFDEYIEVYGYHYKELKFVHNEITLDRNDQRKVEEVFKKEDNYIINVFELKSL